jgi:hypothetical protein
MLGTGARGVTLPSFPISMVGSTRPLINVEKSSSCPAAWLSEGLKLGYHRGRFVMLIWRRLDKRCDKNRYSNRRFTLIQFSFRRARPRCLQFQHVTARVPVEGGCSRGTAAVNTTDFLQSVCNAQGRKFPAIYADERSISCCRSYSPVPVLASTSTGTGDTTGSTSTS